LPSRAEEEPAVVAAAEASIAPPPPVPAVVVEEGETAMEATTPQAALEPPVEAVPSSGDVVLVLDEDSTPPPSSGSRDVVMTPSPEPTPVVVATDSLPAAEVPEPSQVAEVPGPFATVEVVETSSAQGAVTVEELMELAMCRYIDFPGFGIIDLEAPQHPEKVLEVATERMFTEPSIMETIASVSKALHEYERAGGFAPAAAAEAAEAALEAHAAGTESVASVPAPPPTSEDRVASLPQPAEASETVAAVIVTNAVEVDNEEAGSSPHTQLPLVLSTFAYLMGLPPPSKSKSLPRRR
jgi:hypothetical protein